MGGPPATPCALPSPEEAGRYLETYKAYEQKPPDLLKERVEQDFLSRVSYAPPCPPIWGPGGPQKSPDTPPTPPPDDRLPDQRQVGEQDGRSEPPHHLWGESHVGDVPPSLGHAGDGDASPSPSPVPPTPPLAPHPPARPAVAGGRGGRLQGGPVPLPRRRAPEGECRGDEGTRGWGGGMWPLSPPLTPSPQIPRPNGSLMSCTSPSSRSPNERPPPKSPNFIIKGIDQ